MNESGAFNADSDSEYDLGELEEAEMAAQIQEGIGNCCLNPINLNILIFSLKSHTKIGIY